MPAASSSGKRGTSISKGARWQRAAGSCHVPLAVTPLDDPGARCCEGRELQGQFAKQLPWLPWLMQTSLLVPDFLALVLPSSFSAFLASTFDGHLPLFRHLSASSAPRNLQGEWPAAETRLALKRLLHVLPA